MTDTYPKFKSETTNRVWNGSWYQSSDAEPPVITTGAWSDTMKTTDSVFLGASPRGWRNAIVNGGNAGSALTGQRIRIKGSGGSVTAIKRTFVKHPLVQRDEGNSAMILSQPGAASSVASALADTLARENMLKSVLRVQNTWRGGNFLAEVAETIHMLRHPITSLFGHTTRFVNGVHRIRKIRDHKRYGQKLGQLWLAYSFGWKPLFEDIKDYNAAMIKLLHGTGHDTKRVVGTGRSEIFTPGASNVSVGFNFSYCELDQWTKSFANVKYYGAIHARPENLSTVRDTFGVNAEDIVPAIWEAVPWSFLIDYFVNVQQVLDSMRFAKTNFGWLMLGYKNTVYKVNSGWRARPAALAAYNISPSVGTASSEAVYKHRNVVDQMPWVNFRFKIPGLGSLKWVNVAALAAQIRASRPSRS